MMEEEMGSKYFESVYNQLSSIEKDAPWANQVMAQLHLHKMDVRFLKVFCLCIETWDEESKETLRSMIITPLNVIWADEEHSSQSIGSRLFEIRRKKGVRCFYPVAFDLEGKIQQTMLQIEGCENLVSCSMQVSKYSTTIDEMLRFLGDLLQNLNDLLNYRAVEIFPFKKQIDTLKDKLVFLCNSLKKIATCRGISQEFVDFVRVFSNKAAYLTCLYWVKKEANEHVAAETNLLLLDMMHKIKPCAPVIAASYFAIMDSNNIMQPSDSIRLGETVPCFVDLFFEHQETSLKDDFLILRDRLIFVLTFLTDPPRENAKDAGDLIRSQIHALFREDAYLHQPFDEMKEDLLSNKKMLLSDFMIKIEMNAKIIQLHHGFSAPSFVLEEKKLNYMFFVPVQRELSLIEKHAHWLDDKIVCQLQLYRMELRFLWMFLHCFLTRDDLDEGISANLSSLITSLEGIWRKEEQKGLLAARIHEIRRGDIPEWHQVASELEGKIQLSKLEIKARWDNLFHWSFRCKPLTSNKIMAFLDSITNNLKDLGSYKAVNIVPFIKQIEALEDKLVLLQNLLKLTANCINNKELGKFNMFVQVFANNAACLTFLYWANEANDETANEISVMVSDMLQMIKPDTPDVVGLYFGTLKAIYLQRSDSLLFGQAVSGFVDFFLEDLVIHLKDDFHIFRDEIIFLLTFLNDPPNGKGEEPICIQIDVLFSEGVYGLLPFDDMKRDFSTKKVLLSDFMAEIEMVYAKIRQHHCKFPDLSSCNFPKITAPRFLDFLIQNIRNVQERMNSDRTCLGYAKYKIMRIEEELVSLSPFFNHILEQQSEQKELKDSWLQVVDVVHLTEHVINSCFVFNHPVWYHVAYLSDVLDRIKVVKSTMLEKINTSNAISPTPRSDVFISTPGDHVWTSEIDEEVVGFEEEAGMITDRLLNYPNSLDIVSIVGMAGSGKTTLAKKVYGSYEIKYSFQVYAFCSVSQVQNERRLLLNILSDVTTIDDNISKMNNDGLAYKLWMCLRGRKYLIVLDDIWSINAWFEIRRSFPDDRNGSRVMLTTQSHQVAMKAQIHSRRPHQLRFLTHVESWKLLQKKVFQNDIPQPDLIEIGKLIAKNCKGLPLTIVLIARVLARTERSMSRWTEIAERLDYYVYEGFVDKLKSCYKHLPQILKPCFLYLGAFPKDRLIRAKKLMLLWIAEGFIHESETKSKEDVAKEYLNDLVDRSLIIISARSSIGEVKTFHVNGQLYDFCQRKCVDRNFFGLGHGIATSGSSSVPSIDNHYRVSMKEQSDITLDDEPSLGRTRSLLYFGKRGGLFDSIPLINFKLAQVLHLETIWWNENDLEPLTCLVHVRHIEATTATDVSIPSSICNLWNMEALILRHIQDSGRIYLPETLWRMKHLRYVKVDKCKLKFPVGYEHEAYPRLDKVVTFSNPILSSGEDVERLLHRLPAVREFSCQLDKSLGSVEERVETLDFYRELESLKLNYVGKRNPYFLIKFPATLKKLTLQRFRLTWTNLSAIEELQCLQVLKLRWNSFPGPRLDMEDMVFPNLKVFELHDTHLSEWYASNCESFPCLEQLLIECRQLKEIPLCLSEISTLKRIEVKGSPQVESSVREIQEEHMDMGNKVEVLIQDY